VCVFVFQEVRQQFMYSYMLCLSMKVCLLVFLEVRPRCMHRCSRDENSRPPHTIFHEFNWSTPPQPQRPLRWLTSSAPTTFAVVYLLSPNHLCGGLPPQPQPPWRWSLFSTPTSLAVAYLLSLDLVCTA